MTTRANIKITILQVLDRLPAAYTQRVSALRAEVSLDMSPSPGTADIDLAIRELEALRLGSTVLEVLEADGHNLGQLALQLLQVGDDLLDVLGVQPGVLERLPTAFDRPVDERGDHRLELVDRDFPPESGQINPFLHLSLHLAIEEQLSIDQPPGVRAAFEAACARRGERHDALHDALECLGETLFNAQRSGGAPDGAAYVAALRKRAGLAA